MYDNVSLDVFGISRRSMNQSSSVDKKPWPSSQTNFNRNLAVIIGIDDYEGTKISKLSTPVSDATALAKLLKDKFGYDNVLPLMNADASLAGLKTLFNETLPNGLKPTESDRLIVYFAGHGVPKNSDKGPTGYLVPQDARSGQEETFLPMTDVWEALEKLQCHHLLIILDCCFAGQFRWASTRKLTVVWDEIHREHYDRFIRYPAWQVITSSAYDQEALDQVKLSQDSRGIEENTKHSPFALALLEALGDESNADYTGDGVITAQELIVYLEERLAKLSKERQVPGLYPLKREYDKGQFIFVDPKFSPDTLSPAPELNPENNPYRGLNSFEERHANFFFGREKLIDELRDHLINSLNNCPLTAVLGVSGSGKSSLVKAGLVSKLRKESEKGKWYILEPMRPGLSPFAELAKVFLPITDPELLTDLNQINFLDKNQKDINIQQLAKKWSNTTNKAKLLLILDYYEKLKNFCQESEKFSKLHDDINDALENVINKIQTKSEFLKEKIVEWVKSHPETKILLVVDQFEELITLAQSDSKANQSGSDSELTEGQKFLEFLKVILQECSQGLRVVVTLRSDFEPRFINSPLKDYWNDARFPVRAMNSDELREAIAGPAEKQALNFQPDELIGQLVDEVGQMPGALPLLSFTLSELYIKLYERNKVGSLDRTLQRGDYDALGGVAGALTCRATEEYEALDEKHQATMRRLMLRMVSLEGGAIARRRVVDSELIYADDAEKERVNAIKDRLVAARLLVKGQENGVPYVEPAHDFLVRGWDRLQDWIRGEQENLSLQQRLTIAAVEWQGQKNSEINHSKVEPVINWMDQSLFTVENLLNQVSLKLVSIVKRSQNQQGQTKEKSVQFLWDSNPYLKVLDQKLESDQHWLNKVETEFVKESILQKRRGVSWRWRIAIAVILGLSGLTLFAFNQRKTAIAREIAAQSQLTREQQISNLQQSTLLAVEAMRRFPSLEADQALRSSLSLLPRPIVSIKHTDSVNQVVFSPNGKYLASASSDKTIKISEVDTGKQIFAFRHDEEVNAITFSPDGKYLASASGDDTARIWNLENGQEVLKFPHDDDVLKVIFSPDGQYLVLENRESTRLWKIESKEQIFQFKGNINQVIFSPNGRYLAVAIDNMAKILDISQRQIVKSLKHKSEDSVKSIAFSPDGQYLATASIDGQQEGDSNLGMKNK